MNILRSTVLVVGLLGLSGCTAFSSFSEVDALNDAKAVGSPFTQALAAEYRDYANNELKGNLDYPDALHFARKGLAAAAGDTVLPEPVADWNLGDSFVQELAAARGRLILAYDLGARESAPQLSARAQAKFDCWIEQQEETWQKDVPGCKNDFLKVMGELESGLNAPPPAAPVAAAEEGLFGVDPNQPMAAENAMYLVFFDWDSSKLGQGANSVLDAVAAEVSKNPPNSVNVVGHTDTSGSKQYNARLAMKRANAVRDALVDRGLDAGMLMLDAKGEDELLVQTPDDVREPANRRVNISFN